MRRLPLFLVPLLAAGCSGNIADHVGPRSSIVSPQLLRFGLDPRQVRCVGEKLGAGLTPLQLRQLVRSAGAVTQGYYEPSRLTVRDFAYVASTDKDPAVSAAFSAAINACGAGAVPTVEPGLPPEPEPPTAAPTAPGVAPPPPASPTSQPKLAAAWINLGAALSGQSIAIDASTIAQTGSSRQAWFRMTDPGAVQPSDKSYLLRVDCKAKTIASITLRKQDAAGVAVETPDEGKALPVKGGTVMEIAYFSLCT